MVIFAVFVKKPHDHKGSGPNQSGFGFISNKYHVGLEVQEPRIVPTGVYPCEEYIDKLDNPPPQNVINGGHPSGVACCTKKRISATTHRDNHLTKKKQKKQKKTKKLTCGVVVGRGRS